MAELWGWGRPFVDHVMCRVGDKDDLGPRHLWPSLLDGHDKLDPLPRMKRLPLPKRLLGW